MACLWTENDFAEWTASLLGGDADSYALTRDPADPVRATGEEEEEAGTGVALLVRSLKTRSSVESWGLLSGPGSGVRVNGRPMVTGLRMLRDRDEIRTPALATMFFTADTRPVVEPRPASDGKPECPRCKQEIEEGAPSVRCPNCGTRHHQIEGVGEKKDLPCWTYSEKCAVCGHPTSMEGGFRWTPEDL